MLIKSVRIAAVSIAIVMLAGCASSSRDLGKAYISPGKYRDYSCDELHSEAGYISSEVQRLAQSLDKEANKDTAQAAGFGALGLFTLGIGWIGLASLEGGDGPEAAEYSRLKGEFEAVRSMATQKKCRLE